MLKALLPAVSTIIMTQPDTPRAYGGEELAAIARGLSPAMKIDVEPDPLRALQRAWTWCPVVCAAGSIFLVGNLLARIGAEARDL
jgi:folylpolyglutamate synthase/dihydropteroate synthase